MCLEDRTSCSDVKTEISALPEFKGSQHDEWVQGTRRAQSEGKVMI